jgi:curved DNA-binding protein CbpA
VREDASDLEIKVAYHRLAKRFHPDYNPHEKKLSELRFKLISEAYNNLRTVERRRHYNQLLKNKNIRNKIQSKPVAKNDNHPLFAKKTSWDWLGLNFIPLCFKNKKV